MTSQAPHGGSHEAGAPDAIFQIASGFMAAKHLFVANELGIFAALADGSAPLDALAERVDVVPTRLRVVADAMVAVGLLERVDDQYHNSRVAATFLTGTTPADLRPFLRFWN